LKRELREELGIVVDIHDELLFEIDVSIGGKNGSFISRSGSDPRVIGRKACRQ
jgi:8-oxo-dGTP pyrophosphatase MutT (NUDIX family)